MKISASEPTTLIITFLVGVALVALVALAPLPAAAVLVVVVIVRVLFRIANQRSVLIQSCSTTLIVRRSSRVRPINALFTGGLGHRLTRNLAVLVVLVVFVDVSCPLLRYCVTGKLFLFMSLQRLVLKKASDEVRQLRPPRLRRGRLWRTTLTTLFLFSRASLVASRALSRWTR